MYCPKCGTVAATDATFCHRCGTRLPQSEDTGTLRPADKAADDAQDAGTCPRGKVYPQSLDADQYAHPLDRRSLESIAKFSPVVAVTRAIMRNWNEPMVKGQLLGGTVRVSPEQFGEIHEMVADCAAILNMEVPDVFIKHDPMFNAMTLGVERPLIILHSSLVDSFPPEELSYIIGHEMGHIKSQHSLYLSAAYILTMGARGLADRLFGLGSLLMVPAMQALQAWMRKAELTADRAGLLCVQDLGIARRALIKLAVGSGKLFDRLNLEEYLRQADHASKDEYGRVTEFLQTHPHIANRVRELKYFHDSALYCEVLGSGPKHTNSQVEQIAAETVARGHELLTRVGGSLSGLLAYRSTSERALAEFDRVVTRYPQTDAARQALYYKGLAHANLRQPVEAAKAFQAFVLHNPLHELAPDAIWGLAVTLERSMADREGAVREYSRLLVEFPESPRAQAAEAALARLGANPEQFSEQAKAPKMSL